LCLERSREHDRHGEFLVDKEKWSCGVADHGSAGAFETRYDVG